MPRINWARVFGSGVLTGASAFALGVVSFVTILWVANEQTAMMVLGGRPFALPRPATAFVLLALYLVMGVVIIWLYASFRSSYGAGRRTAAIAGFTIWLVVSLTIVYLNVAANFPVRAIVLPVGALLIAIVSASQLGAAYYKD